MEGSVWSKCIGWWLVIKNDSSITNHETVPLDARESQFQLTKSDLTMAEEDEMVLLFNIIGSVGFNQGSDGWKWNLGKEAVFTVQSIKEVLHNTNYSVLTNSFFLNNWISKKVNFFWHGERN
ncbi:hypothetical protein R6Q57_011651 [Mikania cordata]